MFEAGDVYSYRPLGDTAAPNTRINLVVLTVEKYAGDRYLIQYMEIGDEAMRAAVIHPDMIKYFIKLENPEDV
jgi:hypothetical protein